MFLVLIFDFKENSYFKLLIAQKQYLFYVNNVLLVLYKCKYLGEIKNKNPSWQKLKTVLRRIQPSAQGGLQVFLAVAVAPSSPCGAP